VNHYPHHIGDFAKDTMGFSQGAIGAYRLLMDAYYANEEAPPAEDVYVIGRATTPTERKNVDKALTKFELRDGRYCHKRVEEELAAFRKRSEEGAEKANRRWRKHAASNAESMPGAMPTACQSDAGRHAEPHAAAMLASSHKPVKQPQEQAAPKVSPPGDSPPIAALAALCVRFRVNADGAKALLHLRQFVAEGVTEAQLADAILLARDRKPDPELIPLAYLAPIVADLRAGKVRARPISQDDAIAQAMANIAAKESPNATH
jgi:uncharacterized protein YdaU (DUF1376 family)